MKLFILSQLGLGISSETSEIVFLYETRNHVRVYNHQLDYPTLSIRFMVSNLSYTEIAYNKSILRYSFFCARFVIRTH